MDAGAIAGQLVTALAGASSLFLVAAGLSLIFGVSRVVNFAHGSFYMLGLYAAVSLVEGLRAAGWPAGPAWWAGVLAAAVAVGALGALVEVLVLRRIYAAPELFQLLATFALLLVIKDAALAAWGPEDLLGPKAPGLGGAVELAGRAIPQYDLLLIALAPLVLALLAWMLARTRFGLLVRAATQDREMVAALGADQRKLFTATFALGCFLAALGGALQMPREPASLGLDLAIIGEAFVVVVVGGMGSIGGAAVAALAVSLLRVACIAVGTVDVLGVPVVFSKFTLVAEFVLMAAVLAWRPQGLFGRGAIPPPPVAHAEAPVARVGRGAWWWALPVGALAAAPLLDERFPYLLVIGTDLLIAVLFAQSLHFAMGPAGLHSFGHAAWFGLGAYGVALAVKATGLGSLAALAAGPLLAAVFALGFSAFAVRLGGVYFSMLTLAFAQIAWSVVFQWDEVTGGSNGLLGLWPQGPLADRAVFWWVTLALVTASVLAMRHLLAAPFGHAMRAVRDAPPRAEAIGLDGNRVRRRAFVVSAAFGGLAGALFALSKGTISPEALGVERSVNALVMVLLGGVQAFAGPLLGAVAYTALQDWLIRGTEYWRALLGGTILLLVLAFPGGIAGGLARLARLARWGGNEGTGTHRAGRSEGMERGGTLPAMPSAGRGGAGPDRPERPGGTGGRA